MHKRKRNCISEACPKETQEGYLARETGGLDEVLAMPIVSTETDQPIAAIVVGFKPIELGRQGDAGITNGIWLNGRLHLPAQSNASRTSFDDQLREAIENSGAAERSLTVSANGERRLLFYKQINPNSLFPPAYEVCIYPLTDLIARQQRVRWRIGGLGAIVLLGGFIAGHFASGRLSVPMKNLALVSAADRAQRARAEAALEKTNRELQRSARFSANTSHQLKTPITVLRAGLEELRSRKNLSREMREEISALIHQTFRITSIIEDLLLLSQMDAGRLQINFSPVDLTHLIEAQLDDLSALPDTAEINVESECAPVQVAGEQHYLALVLQNLLENARKYNRPGGRIRISCREDGELGVPADWQYRTDRSRLRRRNTSLNGFIAVSPEKISTGHGLGLDLARELVRLHGGDVRLVHSGDDWTEFEVRFRLVRQTAVTPAEVG